MKDTNKAFLIGMKHIAVCVGLALFLVTIALPVVSHAGEYGFPEYYPGNFDGAGRIDRIAADEVVINDVLFKLSFVQAFPGSGVSHPNHAERIERLA